MIALISPKNLLMSPLTPAPVAESLSAGTEPFREETTRSAGEIRSER